MKKFKYFIATILLFCTAGGYAEEMVLEVIPLKHRLSIDVIPIIQPLVVPGGTVTGMNNQLIVKTTTANLAEIKQVLNSIDQAARRLMITVKQDVDGNIDRDESGFSGRYQSGDVSAASPDTGSSREGLVISGKDDEGNVVRYRSLSTRSHIEDKNTYSIQTLEGQPAFIQSGQSVPVANIQTYVTPGGVIVQDGVEYRDVTSGFYVLPRLSGDHVTLLVAPRLHKINTDQGAVFDLQDVETTASGRLGEWIPIGAITQQVESGDRRNLISTRKKGQEQRTILIKVDEIK